MDMEILIIVLLLIVVAEVLLNRKRTSVESEHVPAGPAPVAPDSLKQDLLNRMEEFLRRDLFSLVMQPVVDFRSDTAYNGEVLSCLNHPERGVIFPDQFLPAVNEMGLYPQFDRYIFRKCCVWLRWSAAEGERLDCISCNFSRETLSEENIVRDLIQIADSYDIPHSKLGVEITEREKETDGQQLLKNLKLLKEAGFRIILDDYGSGVTSAADLLQYPLDIVKTDRSMLLNTCTEKGKTEFGELVTMAIRLGMEVVCEGIETEEQNRFARESGCHDGQGFLFCRPVSQERMFAMLYKRGILEDDL